MALRLAAFHQRAGPAGEHAHDIGRGIGLGRGLSLGGSEP